MPRQMNGVGLRGADLQIGGNLLYSRQSGPALAKCLLTLTGRFDPFAKPSANDVSLGTRVRNQVNLHLVFARCHRLQPASCKSARTILWF
jgi:hypothetical protein